MGQHHIVPHSYPKHLDVDRRKLAVVPHSLHDHEITRRIAPKSTRPMPGGCAVDGVELDALTIARVGPPEAAVKWARGLEHRHPFDRSEGEAWRPAIVRSSTILGNAEQDLAGKLLRSGKRKDESKRFAEPNQ